LATRELFDERNQRSTMSAPLNVSTDGDTAEHGVRARNIDPDDTNGLTMVQQQLGMISRRPVIGAVRVVDAECAAGLEQYLASKVVVLAPLLGSGRRHERVVVRLHVRMRTAQ